MKRDRVMGKGSKPRPMAVDKKSFDESFDKIFKKEKKKQSQERWQDKLEKQAESEQLKELNFNV